MKKLPIALALAAITAGSVHAAVVYSSENFEGGTPNYTFDGAGGETVIGTVTTATAFTGTDYVPASTSRMGIVANGEVTSVNAEPSGQHGFVSTSQNREMRLASPMTLVADSVNSLTVDFSFLQYGNGFAATGSAILVYSALGDFTDALQIASFGIGQAGSWVETPDFQVAQDTWASVGVPITNGMSAVSADGLNTAGTVVFTNTAKIRFNRVPVSVTAPDSTTNHIMLFDDITITGVPEPSTAALFGLAGFGLLLRRRK